MNSNALIQYEQQQIILSLKKISVKVTKLISHHVTQLMKSYRTESSGFFSKLQDTNKNEGVMSLFFKISNLLLKLMSMEQNMRNSKQYAFTSIDGENDHNSRITDNDIALIKTFAEQNSSPSESHHNNNNAAPKYYYY